MLEILRNKNIVLTLLMGVAYTAYTIAKQREQQGSAKDCARSLFEHFTPDELSLHHWLS